MLGLKYLLDTQVEMLTRRFVYDVHHDSRTSSLHSWKCYKNSS